MQAMKVKANQTFYDISIQYFGTADYAFDIAAFNQKSISSTLSNGEELKLPSLPIITEVVQYYQARAILPATGIKLQPEVDLITEVGTAVPMVRKNQNGLKKVKVLKKQTFYDLSVQYFGTADYAFQIAFLNQKSVSTTLFGGEELVLPVLTKDIKALQYFTARNIIPATGLSIQPPFVAALEYEFPGEFPFSF
ncbi:MAG: hypothetical protein C0525_01320 [Flavobacterium sp.]|nr:hypothetical protein [Flavobacterium sp.]